jgi:hypothetical protein
MNLAHLHIVLNHVPSLGTLLGVLLYIWALIKKNDTLKKASLQLLVLMALAVLPTYLSGNAAAGILRNRTDIPKGIIEQHQNSAILALIFTTLTGTLAWFGLWQMRRISRLGSGYAMGILLTSVLTAVIILNTAGIGGKISHPEIRDLGPVDDVGWRASIEAFANNSWVWPASETLHFVGMALLFGVAALVNLRMLGMMKSIPFKALHRILPIGIFGFVMNVVSGMVFFIASPLMYTSNPGFIIKMAALLIAGVTVIYFTAFEQPWAVGAEKGAPLSAKVVAVCNMASLLGVMYFGRMLPFMRN